MTPYPFLEISLEKLRENLAVLAKAVHGAGCSLAVVTKSFCADEKITGLLLQSDEVDYLADSRVQNLQSYWGRGKKTMLLRLPQACEAAETVRCADISLNSEIGTIRLLNTEAARQNKKHKVILMIDLGDLREGIFFRDERLIFDTVDEIQKLPNIVLAGLGTNLTCYGAVIPTKENLSILADFARRIEEQYRITLPVVSGGNSSSYYLLEQGGLPAGINNLRLGESFVLGNDTAYCTHIKGTHTNAILLKAQILEVQTKPSMPVGQTGVDAFGEKPVYRDTGMQRRAILGIGRQDTDPAGLVPLDPGIGITGSSSDHLILDISKSHTTYAPGDEVSFALKYGALLRLFTSAYVSRRYV